MPPRLHLTALVVLACCNGPPPLDTATGQPVMLHWSCPKEGTVVYYQTATAGTERTDKTRWLGAEENDPDVCLRADGARLLFARWNLSTLMLTADEDKQFRPSMSAFLHGRANEAHFITRTVTHNEVGGPSAGNEQILHFYTIKKIDDIQVDGKKMQTVVVHVNNIYAGGDSQYWQDQWLDYKSNIVLHVAYTNNGRTGSSSYKVTHIDSPVSVSPEILDNYAGTYRDQQTGAILMVKRERNHLVTSRPMANSQPEYPYTDHDFYFLNYRQLSDRFVTDTSGRATRVVHREAGKPDEVLDRVNMEVVQN